MIEKLLCLEGITKTFGNVIANDKISFELQSNEVHALLGENGAGKTTLMNVLYGLYHPDQGSIILNGIKISIRSPKDAISHGIGMVHQHFMLIPTLTVLENIILGIKHNPLKIDFQSAAKKVRKLCNEFNIQIDLQKKVGDLSIGVQQKVELLKALYREADILILDEPTAVLTPQEVDELFKTLNNLVEMGKSIIYISHKLWEVMRISHQITILRGGKSIKTVKTSQTDQETLAELMVGRKVLLEYEKEKIDLGESILTLDNVSTYSSPKNISLKNINSNILSGEIVGVAGVDGNGQEELAEAIMNIRPLKSGVVRYKGKDITDWGIKDRLNSGFAHIPADRHEHGLILDFTISENTVLNDFNKEPYTKKGVFSPLKVKENGKILVSEYDVRPADSELPARLLSGGNQQKVVLARELSKQPSLIIASQPTRGLDIGATEFVHKRLIEEKKKGAAILVISSDLDELLLISDRILVMFEGKFVGEVCGPEYDFKQIGLLMGGISPADTLTEGTCEDYGDE